MEALSGAASGIAVVSLTIQLIQSVALIREFIQDVKGASKELRRLMGKLELLNALLEDVQKVLEQQSSLLDMHFPAPSMAIFKCLQSCEDSLQPLVDLVKKLTLPQSQSNSSRAKLKNEIKLGLKAKEITTLETRIQNEIDILTNSLSINQSGILTSLFPILLRNQETILKSYASSPVAYVQCKSTRTTATTLDIVSSSAPSPVRYSQQTILVRSALERLGFHRRKVIRYQDWEIKDQEGNVESRKRDILWTADEVSAVWTFLGLGMTFTKQHPYGSIFPSLRTYPVGRVYGHILELMKEGSVREFQEKMTSGALHPFLREATGHSLLHFAASYSRPDLCRLLLQYGVKPELTSYNQSPLSFAMSYYPSQSSFANTIDTYRCFLDDPNMVCELNTFGDMDYVDHYSWLRAGDAKWLWQKNIELFVDEDLRHNQQVIIRRYWSGVAATGHDLLCGFQCPIIPKDRGVLNDIQYGRCEILPAIFLGFWEVSFSYIIGAQFLNWLIYLDLDPEVCVASERANFGTPGTFNNYRIVFQRDWEQKWVLGFEWVVDHQEPGYALLSEFTSLVVERTWEFVWPFRKFKRGNKRTMNVSSARFNRHMAAKERKERARLGLKQPRSQMPGAWKW